MISPIPTDVFDPKIELTWQQHIKHAIRTPEALARALNLPIPQGQSNQTKSTFPLFAPLPFVSRIQPGNPQDPLLRQILPTIDEQESAAGYVSDPLKEQEYATLPGMLHKYESRALLVVNGTCAVHCRYCFRREFPYQESLQSAGNWELAIEQIASDTSLQEVILSGGDPLTIVDETIAKRIQQLEKIKHLQRLRIHTRLPIVIPQRITSQLIEILNTTRLAPVIVVHANHPNEIDPVVTSQLQLLSQSRATILNQSVLLRGINDDVTTLIDLSQRLIQCGTAPYYLHQLDPVSGTQHFHVPIERGRELIRQMRNKTSGYLVPRYVQEQPGQGAKTILD